MGNAAPADKVSACEADYVACFAISKPNQTFVATFLEFP